MPKQQRSKLGREEVQRHHDNKARLAQIASELPAMLDNPYKHLLAELPQVDTWGAALLDALRRNAEPTAGNRAGGDEPDSTGFVANPADPVAYLPAAKLLAEHGDGLQVTAKTLRRLLNNYSETHVRWTRPRRRDGKLSERRLSVHLGDWLAFRARVLGGHDNGFPRLAAGEVEQRKVAVRAGRL